MTHPSTTQTRELVVPGRVERQAKRQKRSKRIGLVVLIGLALTVGVAGKALAWHVLPGEAKRTCKTLTLSTVVPKADWFTGTATLKFKGAADSRTTPGPLSVTVPFDKSEPAGTASGEVTWTDSNETEQVSASYGKAPEGCIPPPPPAKQGSAGVITTCDSVTFNFGGADEGVKQYAKVDGKTKSPATLNGSVTFDNLAPGEHPVEYGSGSNVQRGSFEARDCTPDQPKKDEFAGTATSKKRVEPNPDDSIPVTPKQPTMGALPFTGPYDYLYPVAGVLLLVGPLLVLAARFRRPKGVQR